MRNSRRTIYHCALIALTLTALAATLYGIYLSADGQLFRPPLELKNDIFLTTRGEYRRGDMVRATADYCKLRDVNGVVQYQLVDTIIRFYPERPVSASVGCFRREIEIERIPGEVLPGTYHFEGKARYDLNPFSRIIYTFRTNDFNIVQ